jgi:hypothetical protein
VAERPIALPPVRQLEGATKGPILQFLRPFDVFDTATLSSKLAREQDVA